MQPRGRSLMHRTSELIPQQYTFNPLQNDGPLPHHRPHHNYDDARSDDEIDSSPSPPERVGYRAQAFGSYPPPSSHVFPSSAVQSHWRDDGSSSREYTPSPTEYTSVRSQNQAYYLPQRSFHPHHHSGEHYIGNSHTSIDSFGSHHDTQIDRQTSVYSHPPVGRTQQKSQAVRLRPVSELPDRFRSVFKFGVFNAIQSTCFDAVLHSNENMVISGCELTGDTVVFGKGVWGDAKNAQIMDDHSRILTQIKLFLVDEVHILNESRGSTLEVVVSRMKARGSDVRFVLVSATVPNIEDVASWIGSIRESSDPGQIFQFGDEYRPCKLSRFVYGVPKAKGQNDFAYAHTLDARLFSVLQRHAVDKPILVFCPTRKGTITTARQLAKEYEEAIKMNQQLPWSRPLQFSMDQTFHDKDLAQLASLGIGVHHAGLTIDDRKAVEDLYLRKVLRVLLATSTLAVGVNLPAHLVVIKDVKLYQNGESKEYSDLDIMQMMGRAGRPQFDTEGIAIIMCETELERKYRDLVQGTTPIESSLHTNLTEHLNSEIGLGTITNVKNAQEWLLSSFLYRRIQKNPQHYDIGKDERQSWQDKVQDIVMDSIEQLRGTELITYSSRDGELSSTEFGDIMSKFYIRRETMKAILDLSPTASLREILEMIAASEEYTRKSGAITTFDSQSKKFKARVTKYSCLCRYITFVFTPAVLQMTSLKAVLAGLPLNNAEYKSAESQPCLEAFSVFRHVTRIAIAVAEVAIIKKNGAQVKHGLELYVCFGAKILTWLKKHCLESPFGFEVLAAANELPKYFLALKDVKVSPSDGSSPVDIELSIECGIIWDNRASKASKKRSSAGMTTLLTITSDFVFVDFRRISTKALRENKSFVIHAQLTRPSQTINVSISSDKIAGITVTESFKPSLPANKYPTLNTRPLTSLEMDLEGLEDVADFWDMKPDDDEDDDSNIPIKDLTRPRSPLRSSTSTQKNTKPKEKTVQSVLRPADKEQSSRIINTPVQDTGLRKRSDGKYDCNHTCKDKSVCRHMCCRDGLPEPPRKKNDTKPNQSSKKANHSSPNLPSTGLRNQVTVPLDDVPNLERPKAAKRDPVLEQLDSLHTGADINRRLRLSDGKRLKLTAPKSSRKRNPAPNFDIELATLKRSPSPTSQHMLSDSQSDDDLPNMSELLGQGNHVRSKTDYVNSKVDGLIRNDEDKSAMYDLSQSLPPIRKRTYDCDDSTTALLPNDSPPPKRLKSSNPTHRLDSPRRKSVNEERRQKHFKAGRTLFGSSDVLIEMEDKVPAQSTSTVHRSLFLAESSDVDVDIRSAHSPSKPPLQQPYDDFFFDESYFDILPDPQQAVEPSFHATDIAYSSVKPQATSNRLQSSQLCSQFGAQVNTTNKPYSLPGRTSSITSDHKQMDQEMKPSNNAVEVDVLAEFESWLESGAVDIVS
ncbi:hypothetical protein AZE42_04133 [Rhizopogon vesiculosus]|uniref:DNA 3'-5' helicase n=1 Tax=Rhizopogon vesiculosus TaxID=180088 RepID=A0A1J8Q9H6_9AGAM|nr:hypothetical protein AZE42_04133 [Rhizopogon vesiculosus]